MVTLHTKRHKLMYVLKHKGKARLWKTAQIIRKLLKDPQAVVASEDSHHIVFSTIEGSILLVFLIAPTKGFCGLHFVREGGDYDNPKDGSWFDMESTIKAFGTDNREINYELGHSYEFVLEDADDIRALFRNAFWQTLIDERFRPYAWTWALDYLLECIISIYYVCFRGIKLGVDCDQNGSYFHDFSDGRPIFYKLDHY